MMWPLNNNTGNFHKYQVAYYVIVVSKLTKRTTVFIKLFACGCLAVEEKSIFIELWLCILQELTNNLC